MTANPGGGDYRRETPVDEQKCAVPGCRLPGSHSFFTEDGTAVIHHPPVSVAQDATDATETPARTPGGSGTAEARTEAQGAAEALRDMADRTIAEAVCCDEYERFKAGAPRPKFPHEICYWSAAHAEALRSRADEIDAERESATDPGMTNLEAELVALRAQVARVWRYAAYLDTLADGDRHYAKGIAAALDGA